MTDELSIYITTHGRVGKQRTLENLPPEWLDRTWLVVRPEEATAHAHQVMVLPEPMRLSPTRQWVMENAKSNFVCLLDDDLKFGWRPDQDTPSLPGESQEAHDKRRRRLKAPAPAHVVARALGTLEAQLSAVAHASISAREGNNTHPGPVKMVGRALRALAFRRDTFLEQGIRFDRVTTGSDFDVTLQLLRKGFRNVILFRYTTDQNNSNSPGGCSEYRTAELHAESCRRLAELHPGLVKVVEKPARNWKGFGDVRTDVTIYWQRAYEESLRCAPEA